MVRLNTAERPAKPCLPLALPSEGQLCLVMRSASMLVDARLMHLRRLLDQNVGAELTKADVEFARRPQGPVD